MAAPPLGWRLLAAYGAPGFALAMPTIPAFVLLPTFYADTMGLGLAAVGTALLLARVVDVLSDPLAGWLSDARPTRFGRRKPWIAGGGVVAAAALLALFMPPAGAGFGWLVGFTIALYVGWTFVAVPYTAWGAELTRDYDDRSRLTAAREGLMLAGILAAGAVPAVTAALGHREAAGLAAVAWLAVLAGAPAVAVLLLRVPEAAASPPHDAAARPVRLDRAAVRSALANKPFLRLLAAWFVNGAANGLPGVLFPLYLQHALGADRTQQGLLIFLYFLAGIVAMPLWLWLARRIGKHRAWVAAMALCCLVFVWVPLIPPGAVWAFAAVCLLTGATLGADLALPPAMQADVVDLDTLRSGQERAGLFFALWSMATKLALGLAAAGGFWALEAAGFDTAAATNGAGAVLALTMIYAVAPVVLKGVAMTLVWPFPLTARRQRIIRARLERRSRSAAPAGQ